MRAIPPTFDPAAVAAVDGLLDEVAAEHRVAIPLAVESGSRAWGFPSPDSDYDARFLYVRPVEDYLSPWLPRDVLERVPDAVLDVNGWDVRKAVQLLVAGNAVLSEWLGSPVVYRGDAAFVAAFRALADRVADRALVGRHYLDVGRGQWARHLQDGGTMPLKKLFYALRPALAVRWLELHPGAAVPPMSLPGLVAETDLPAAVVEEIAALVEAKARTREMGSGSVPPVLRALVAEELRERPWLEVAREPAELAAARADAGAFFREAVARWAPDA